LIVLAPVLVTVLPARIAKFAAVPSGIVVAAALSEVPRKQRKTAALQTANDLYIMLCSAM
jgi:ABC-type phosphate transport system permease subunit